MFCFNKGIKSGENDIIESVKSSRTKCVSLNRQIVNNVRSDHMKVVK